MIQYITYKDNILKKKNPKIDFMYIKILFQTTIVREKKSHI